MRVLAVDPGGVTGLALYDEDLYAPRYKEGEPVVFDSWQADSYDEAVQQIWENLDSGDTALVCEGFVIRQNTHKLDSGAFALTTDLIGACRYLAHTRGIPFVRQTPGDAKSFASDAKLRTLGWYNATPGGHANDAARHLLRYLAGKRHLPILEALTQGDQP